MSAAIAPGAAPVAAVVTDDLEAVRVVRHAVRLARTWDRPLLLVVPLPGAPRSRTGAAGRRRQRDAAAVLGRVVPALAGHPARALVVGCTARSGRTPALSAALRAARRSGAEVLVAGPRSTGRPGAHGLTLFDPATGAVGTGQPAPAAGARVRPRA